MKNFLWLILGMFLGANAVYLFGLVAKVLRHCGGM